MLACSHQSSDAVNVACTVIKRSKLFHWLLSYQNTELSFRLLRLTLMFKQTNYFSIVLVNPEKSKYQTVL